MKTAVTKKVMIMLVTLLLSFQPVLGQTSFGGFDCGQWVYSKTEAHKSWLIGFVSGMNITTNIEKNNLFGDWLGKLNTPEQIFVYVDEYCRAQPLHRGERAALDLYLYLIALP